MWLQDALSHLDTSFNEDYLAADQPTQIRHDVYNLYFQYRPDLHAIAAAEKVSDNAKLHQLCRLLTDLFSADEDARGIFSISSSIINKLLVVDIILQ